MWNPKISVVLKIAKLKTYNTSNCVREYISEIDSDEIICACEELFSRSNGEEWLG